MDKTKSKLAAFFDNDDEESSFPVRWIELTSISIPLHLPFHNLAKDGR
jgi:hypothetical protein